MIDGYRSYCRSCRVEEQKRWRLANPEIATLRNRDYYRRNPKSQRPRHLRRRYDIEIAEYKALAEAQGNACAICRTVAEDTWNMQVDHCHVTGKVRGLLCHKCNKGIGLLGDDPTRVAAALRYLESA
jgi:hypothetical protein